MLQIKFNVNLQILLNYTSYLWQNSILEQYNQFELSPPQINKSNNSIHFDTFIPKENYWYSIETIKFFKRKNPIVYVRIKTFKVEKERYKNVLVKINLNSLSSKNDWEIKLVN